MSVFIAILNQGNIRIELLSFILNLIKTNQKFKLILPNLRPITSNRNYIVDKFLKSNQEYLLMIDCDIVVPINILDLLKHKKKIITPLFSTQKGNERYLLALEKQENNEYLPKRELKEGLNEVDAVGTGCIFIHREVLEKMKKPIFEFIYDKKGILIKGEDFNFCEKAKNLGYNIYVDTNYYCNHYKEMPI